MLSYCSSTTPEPALARRLNTIRGWLGHVSLDITNIYAETDLEMKAKALATCEVVEEPKTKKRWREDPELMTFLRSL
jgi:integrase/recombinase XerD